MSNKIKIIEFSECQTQRMKERGLGGVRGLVKTKDNVTYVVKPEALNQTLNEIMAQIIINFLGLTPIEYAFVIINGTHYGALKYLDGLKRIGRKNYEMLTKEQKVEFLKHLFLNSFFDNEDISGEIYLTEDGKIVSLDYGDAGIKMPLLNLDKRSDFEKRVLISSFHKKSEMHDFISQIRVYIEVVSKQCLDESIGIDDLRQVISDVINGFINADYSEYEEFLKELLTLHGELLAFIYQEHLNGLIEAAEELKTNLNKLFEDMPA